MKKLYTSLVRPILEYGNVVWAPTLKRDQQTIENVQRRTTKLVPEVKNLEYGVTGLYIGRLSSQASTIEEPEET